MDLEAFGKELAEALPGAVLTQAMVRGELTVEVKTDEIIRVLKYLRDNPTCAFEELIDICGVDWPQRAERFDVVYHLLSVSQNARIRVKLRADETTPVPSAVELFIAANWFERETFDMYGVTFADHPDMRRILTDYGFSGYPLRKDFPLTGHVEVHYDEELKRVVYRPVRLVQEFRNFDFESPWEGAPYFASVGDKVKSDG
jgi:NADH-quinone oxidoreductase subunit C